MRGEVFVVKNHLTKLAFGGGFVCNVIQHQWGISTGVEPTEFTDEFTWNRQATGMHFPDVLVHE